MVKVKFWHRDPSGKLIIVLYTQTRGMILAWVYQNSYYGYQKTSSILITHSLRIGRLGLAYYYNAK